MIDGSDPIRTWTLISQQGARPSPRSGHACVLLEDRYLLLFGGYSGQKHLSDMYILDTSSMIWEQKFLPLGHPLGRSAHQITLVAQTRAYMTFGWSPHGVLCDLHALDTRDPLLKTVSVSGGPYSSKLCQVSVEFAKEKEKSAPISIQWHRSKNGKPFAPIEGGEMPKQAPNQRVPIMDPSLTLLRALLTLLSLPPPPPLPLPLSLSLCVFSCVLV